MRAPRFEGYEVTAELGRGAQGTVYRARELATGAERALKVLAGASDTEGVERFQREAQALARIGHGVVSVHRTGVTEGRPYYVMELMKGGSLEERLRRREKLEWREAVALGAKLARTLERAAAAGLVHRDLKPSNVLFDEAGEPRIADFGCARDLQAASLTETGSVVGTLLYMAPEQLEGKKAGPPADVFALGAILHEALAGERPFAGESAPRIFLAIKAGGRARVRERSGCPAKVDLLLDRALAFEAARRPGAAELAADLEELLGRAPLLRDDKKAAARSRVPLVGLVVGLLVLGGAIAWLALRADPQPPVAPPPPVASTSVPRPSPRPAPIAPTISAAALRLTDREVEALVGRASVLAREGGDEQALGLIDRAIAARPRDALPHVIRAMTRRHLKDFQGAFADVNRALELEPDCAPALVERAKLNTRLGRDAASLEEKRKYFDASVQDARSVLVGPAIMEARKELATAHLERGRVLRELGERRNAFDDFEAFINIALPGDARLPEAERERAAVAD